MAWETYSRGSTVSEKLQSLTPDQDSSNNSPSLSISDLYDADSQPITIPASSTGSMPTPKRSNSVVANALAVPGALKDLIYLSASSSKSTTKSTVSDKLQESSSSDDDDQYVGWLDGKRRSGMKLVYGLLGVNSITGSPSTALIADEDEEEDEDDEEEHYRLDTVSSPRADEAEVLDDRTMTNFQKYFVLPESEKLLAGEILYCLLNAIVI